MDGEVEQLLSLKAQYKELTGQDLSGGSGRKSKKTPAQQKPPKEKQPKKGSGAEGGGAPQPAKKEDGVEADAGRKKQTRWALIRNPHLV